MTAETPGKQLELSKQLEFLKLPYHAAILENRIRLAIGGGIGQSPTLMLFLRKAHLGEVSVTVWPEELKLEELKEDLRTAYYLCAGISGRVRDSGSRCCEAKKKPDFISGFFFVTGP